MKKRVGIATYINSNNYGSVLQSYALTEFICSAGYDAQIIDFKDYSLKHNRIMRWRVYADILLCCISRPRLLLKEIQQKQAVSNTHNNSSTEKKRIFAVFQANKMRVSKEDYLCPETFYALICGSDQVWKLTVPGLHAFFFLRFAPKEKRIAYAPSFGCNSIPAYNKKRLKQYIEGMSYLSIREISGVELIKKVSGQTVPQVLDPVLLVGSSFWRQRYSRKRLPESYFVCYFLDENPHGMQQAKELAKKTKRKLYLVEACQTNHVNVEICIPDPIEFVQMIDEAECVFTDSFHGMIFSAMLNTPFVIYDRRYSVSSEQSTRIDSFLQQMELQKQKATNSLNEIPSVDFYTCNLIMDNKREESKRFLIDALTHVVSTEEY